MPEYTGRMTNIATKTMLADNERLQSDTKVKFRMVFMYIHDSAESWTDGV